MKPVVANPTTTITQLLDGLEELKDEEQIKQQINQIIAKLQRKKRNMSEKTKEHFVSMTNGKDPTQFINEIEHKSPAAAKEQLLVQRDLFKMLEETHANGSRPVVTSDAKDELTGHTRGYGNADKPQDYLDAFSNYVQTHKTLLECLLQ